MEQDWKTAGLYWVVPVMILLIVDASLNAWIC
jgi:hypothetical protein